MPPLSQIKTYPSAYDAARAASELEAKGYVRVSSRVKPAAGQYSRRLSAAQPAGTDPDLHGLVIEWCELARKPWAWLLRHVFQVDVTTCPSCGGRMRFVETATTQDAIAELLARQGLRPRPPPRAPTPPPPGQLALQFTKK